MNRLFNSACQIGMPKTEAVANSLLEINPYLHIDAYPEGVTHDNIIDFFDANPKPQVIIDSCDNFAIKIALRAEAKKRRLPLVMATDVGEAVILDMERYDLDKTQQPFGGRLMNVKDPNDFLQAALTIIDPAYLPLKVQESIFAIGQSVPTHPQLGVGAYLSGLAITVAVKAIANKTPLPKERIYIDLESYFNPEYNNPDYQELKKQKLALFKKAIGMED
jgi:hypothetical protein